MNLNEYMKKNKIKIDDMAKDLGITYMYLSNIKLGKRKPSKALAEKIELVTGGEITAEQLRGDHEKN